MFGHTSKDKVTNVTLGLGLVASTTAVAHGFMNMSISTLEVGLASVTIFVYILSRKSKGNEANE